MTIEERELHFNVFTLLMKKVITSKSGDYANADVLSNFKLAGGICGLTPQQNCLSLIATKVARLGVLLKTKVEGEEKRNPLHESIRDSVLDLANYSLLLDMLITDEELGN